MNLIISILTVYGMSAIVTTSHLFMPLRDFAEAKSPNFWKHLTACMQCLPFWVGIMTSFLLEPPLVVNNVHMPELLNQLFTMLFAGSFFSGTSMFIHAVFQRIKKNQ